MGHQLVYAPEGKLADFHEIALLFPFSLRMGIDTPPLPSRHSVSGLFPFLTLPAVADLSSNPEAISLLQIARGLRCTIYGDS